VDKLRKIVRTEIRILSENIFSDDFKNKPRKEWTEFDQLQFELQRYMRDAIERLDKLREIEAILLRGGNCELMLEDIAKVIGGLKSKKSHQ
jgi:hypothetical protein